MKLIIRSHECVDEGIQVNQQWTLRRAFFPSLHDCLQWQRGANLVTVFSASNYNGYPNKVRLLVQHESLCTLPCSAVYVSLQGAIIMLSDNLTMTHSSYDVSS